MQAVVLAAGEGQRLRPFTVNKPKVMIEVANKPIIGYVVEALAGAGIRDIVVVVGYKRSRIMEYLKGGEDFGVKIEYAVQEQQLGTAHALKQAEDLVSSDEFIVVSGDNIFDSETIEKLREPWTVAYKKSDEPTKYGIILTKDGLVEKIIEKPAEEVGNLVNVGIYRFTKEIFREIGDETNLVAVINRMIAEGYEFKCVEAKLWMDIVYPWDILKVNELAMNFSGKKIGGRIEGAKIIGNVVIGEGTIVEPGAVVEGPVVIGENCRIGANSVIKGGTSIGDGCQIGPLSIIQNSVLGNNVVVGGGSCILDSVIDRGCVIGPNFVVNSDFATIRVGEELHNVKTGAFFGERCKVGGSVTVGAGAIVGNNVSIRSHKFVHGNVPDNSLVV